MRLFAARLRNALLVSIVATAVSLPVTASAAEPPIDLPGLPNLGCGSGNGNGNDCTTTTTTPVPVPTTVPGNGQGSGPPITPPGQVTATTAPGHATATTAPGHATATTAPGQVTGTTAPRHSTATTSGDFSTTDPSVLPPTPSGDSRTAAISMGTPSRGLTGFNTAAMPSQIAGAVVMLEGRDDEVVDDEPVADVAAGPISGGFHNLLSPVLPPALVDAAASPLVIVDALYDAFTSSGQALIVPGIAFLFGFGVPGIRRRISLDQVID